MFEKLITDILNKVLGKFIENIDANQLNISISSGKVKLENMKLKTDMFDSMPLPFTLAYGQIGLINLTIPVWNMFNSPLIIEIRDVFAYVRPKKISEWNEQSEQNSFRTQTQNQLENFELFHSNADNMNKKDPSSVDKLIAKIIDNIQLDIKNVYIRYEDSISAVHQGDGTFIIGILLKEFSTYTTDSEWKMNDMQLGKETTNKLTKMKNFAMFLDYKSKSDQIQQEKPDLLKQLQQDKLLFKAILSQEFDKLTEQESQIQVQQQQKHYCILDKFSMEARIQINKEPLKNQMPQIDINLLLGGQFKHLEAQQKVEDNQIEPSQQKVRINFAVRQPQIMRVLKLMEYIGYFNEFQNGALAMFRKNKISKEIADQYINTYVLWKGMSDQKKLKKQADEKRNALLNLENQYTFSQLEILRRFGLKIITQQEEREKDQIEYDRRLKEIKDQKASGWFTSKEKKAQNQKEIDEFSQKLSEEIQLKEKIIKEEEQQEIDLLNDELSKQSGITINQSDFNKLPESYIRFKLKVEIPMLRFEFINEFMQNIFTSECEELLNYIDVGISFIKYQFTLQSLILKDQWSGSKTFPNIIESKEVQDQQQIQQISKENKYAYQVLQKQALFVLFETGKNCTNSPFKVYIETQRSLFIIANLIFVQEVQRTFSSAMEGEQLDFSFYKEQATEKALQYMQTGKELIESLKKGEVEHQAFDITMQLHAPIIIVPESIFNPLKPCLILDAGMIKMDNKLIKYDKIVDYKLVKSKQLLYDRYDISLQNISIIILEEGLGLQGINSYQSLRLFNDLIINNEQQTFSQSCVPILKDFNVQLTFFNCLEPFHPLFPTVELVMQLQNIEIDCCKSILQSIFQLQNSLLDQWDNKEYKLIQKKTIKQNIQTDIQISQEKGLINQVRANADTEKKQIKANVIKLFSQEDNFLDTLNDNLNEKQLDLNQLKEQQLKELQEFQVKEEKLKQAQANSTSMKVYFSVEKFIINLKDEIVIISDQNQKPFKQFNDFVNIQMILFNIEVELDRKQNINVALNIHKFKIQDIQKDSKMALPFRMILSSPLVETQFAKGSVDNNDQDLFSVPQSNLSNQQLEITKMNSIIQKSLVAQLERMTEKDQEDEFKDALDEQDEFQDAVDHKQILNEFEFKFTMTKEKQMSVQCDLSDLRFVISIPTIEKLLKINIGINQMFENIEEYRQIQIQQNLLTFDKVVLDLQKNFDNENESFVSKLFTNQQVESGLNMEQYLQIATEAIQKLQKILIENKTTSDFEEESTNNSIVSQNQSQQENVKDNSFSITQDKNVIIKNEVSLLSFQAKLNNFSVWIPLNALEIKSQIAALSFQSEFNFNRNQNKENTYDIEFNQCIKSVTIDSKDTISLSFNSFTIANLKFYDKKAFIVQEQQLTGNNQGGYNQVNMLQPCKIVIKMETLDQGPNSTIKNTTELDIEPMNLQLGFKEIDFANLWMIEIQQKILKLFKKEQIKQEIAIAIQDKLGQQQQMLEKQQQLMQQSKSLYRKSTNKQTEQIDQQHKKIQKTLSKYKVRCEIITISLIDDSDSFQIGQQLIKLSISDAQINMNQFVQDLENVNSSKNLAGKESYDYMSMTAATKFQINYYNQRSLAYEPLIEPWSVQLRLKQEKQSSEQIINIESEQMFNLNMTFGMALTVRKIQEKLEESKKQAQRFEKLLEKIVLTDQELEEKIQYEQQLKEAEVRAAQGKMDSHYQQANQGYIFNNYTGFPIKFALHNKACNDELLVNSQTQQDTQKKGFGVEKIFQLQPDKQQSTIFVSFQEIEKLQKEAKLKICNGKHVTTLEEDPVKMDIKINGLSKISGVPIEGYGVYSYEAQITNFKSKKQLQKPEQQEKGGLFGFGLIHSSKEKKNIEEQKSENNKIGVLCNIKMNGPHKMISIESQLLLVNNLNITMNFFVQTGSQNQNQLLPNQEFSIESGKAFRVPISWFMNDEPYSIYARGKSFPYLLFKDFAQMFCIDQTQSTLTQLYSQILNTEDYYASVDIQGYKCLSNQFKHSPLQYVVTLNQPLMVTNYNFHPLEIKDLESKQILAQIAPKETAFINKLDIFNSQYKLQWSYIEDQNCSLSLKTQNFSHKDRMDKSLSEKFLVLQNENIDKKVEKSAKYVLLDFEMKKQTQQKVIDYDGEYFDLREQCCSYISSASLMIYPRYMIVNKNKIRIDAIDKGEGVQSFEGFSNNYLNTQKHDNQNQKVYFKVGGYKPSDWFDVSTIGLSGCVDLEMDKQNQIEIDKMPQQYISEKVEYGIQISSAPTPFNKTTIISLMPRYVLVNQLNKPLIIKQKSLKQQTLLLPCTKTNIQQGQLPFNFEKNLNKFILIREPQNSELSQLSKGKSLFTDLGNVEDEHWSTPFSIEDIEDFHVSFSGQKNMNKDQILKVKDFIANVEDEDQQWFDPSQDNQYQRFVRVIITTQDDATILVVFTNPLYPEYELLNKCDTNVWYGQVLEETLLQKGILGNVKTCRQALQLNPNSATPFVWQDRTAAVKKILLYIEDQQEVINLDKALKKKTITTQSNLKYQIEVRVTGNAKKLQITNLVKGNQTLKTEIAQSTSKLISGVIVEESQKHMFINANIKLKGIGISIINDEPKELLVLSISDININYDKWQENRKDGSGVKETISQVKLSIDHLQLDNMLTNANPIILAPQKPLKKDKQIQEESKVSDNKKVNKNKGQQNAKDLIEDTPFIQLLVSMAEGSDDKGDINKVVRLQSFTFQIQEFILSMNTSIINVNLKFVQELAQVFTDEKKTKILLSNLASYEKAKLNSREKFCSILDAKKPILEDSQAIQTNKMFMECIHLGAIKVIVSFSFEKEGIEIDISDPRKGFGTLSIIFDFLATAASISNSTLSFRQLIILDTFVSQEMLTKQIIKNYTRQGIMQFYKLLGSSDMIGNPLGLVDKLGTGVFEFFSEPTKGLIKGPDEFVGGIGKGVKSLVTNVVSGGFGSISKISGSLYSVVKDAQGESMKQIKQPDNVFQGLYYGVSGGVSEIAGGISGLVVKPFEGAKSGGVGGMISGVGKGLFGAISAPISATLRVGTSITQGVSSTATTIGNIGKDASSVNIQYERFRYPRYISVRKVIKVYDKDMSKLHQILTEIANGKYSDSTLQYFCSIPETKYNGEINNSLHKHETLFNLNSILVLTDDHLIYINFLKEGKRVLVPSILFKSKLQKIQKCYVKKVQKSSQQDTEFYTMTIKASTKKQNNLKEYQFVSTDYTNFERIYDILSIIPNCEVQDEMRNQQLFEIKKFI